MFLVLPFRTKNPPAHPPYITYALILINLVVFFFTIHYGNIWPQIKQGVVYDWAERRDHLNIVRLVASMFLHGDLLHIGGNMLFLWIFGSAAEGRLRPGKFLAVYFTTGILSGLVQCLLTPQYGFGASGAIMGIAGAYAYMFPHSPIRVYWYFIYKGGRAEWPAWGVVSYFLFFDILNGLILRAHDGVGHFTHISGFIVGILMCLAFRSQRDSEAVSEVQATRSDLRNKIELLSWAELDVLLDAPTDDMELVLTFCNKAIAQPGDRGEKKALKMIERYKDELLMYNDPIWVASTLLKIPKDTGGVTGTFYLKLGSKLEGMQKYDTAAYIYRRVFDIDPFSPDSNAAILRFGRIWETIYNDKDMARDAYEVYLKLFPDGPLIEEAQKGLARVGGPKVVAPMFRQATIKRQAISDEERIVAPAFANEVEAEEDEEAPLVPRRLSSAVAPRVEEQEEPQVQRIAPNPFGRE